MPKQSLARRNDVFKVFPLCETGFARCERLFWDPRLKDARSTLESNSSKALLGILGCFRSCTRTAGSQC